MKRKIAAILAADVAGYSRLMAEDEEETLRRLASYRAVFSDLVAQGGGRIFNTAGDAILAEFPSAVEAVRCALDVQESLRTRNLAYPPSRQMHFRMGITIGDVVEKDGDLLGDGVNIAARLESLATPGGICISRSVHEAAANKLTVKFSDLGRKELKNIPEPVHAYLVVTDGTPGKEKAAPSVWLSQRMMWPAVAAAAAAALLLVFIGLEIGRTGKDTPKEPLPDAGLAKPKPAEAALPKTDAATKPEEDRRPAEPPAPAKPEPTPSEALKPAPVEEAPPAEKPEPAPVEDAGAAPPKPRPLGPLEQQKLLPRQWKKCREGNANEAINSCRALIDSQAIKGNDLAEIQLLYGRALRDTGDSKGALAALDESIRIAPTADAYTFRGIAHYDLEHWNEAIADYSEALRLDASHGEALNNRAWTYWKTGEFRLAIADADKAVRVLGSKGYVWDTRGHINESLGDREAAIRDYRRALTLDSTQQSSREGLERLGASP